MENTDTAPTDHIPPFPQRTVWPKICLAGAMLAASLGVSIPNVALPTLVDAFGVTMQSAQWVVLSYLLSLTVTVVIAGRLGDQVGRRRIFILGLVIFTAASAACATADSLWILIAARVVQGGAGAILMALTVAMVRDTLPETHTGRVMGLLGTMSAIGTALGPSLGGVIVQSFGWPSIFLVLTMVGMATTLLAFRVFPASAAVATKGARPDWPGTILLALTLLAFLLAVTGSAGHRATLPLLMAAAAGLFFFLLIEARSVAPLMALSAFRSIPLASGMLTNIIVGNAMMATLVVGPFYLASGAGLVPITIGLAMSVGPAISALSGIPAGRAVDRFGADRMLIFGLTQMFIATLALAILPSYLGLAGYLGAIALLTPGYQLVQAANNTAVMTNATPDERGVHSGLLSLSRNLGLMAGASVMGVLFAAASGLNMGASMSKSGALSGLLATFGTAAALVSTTLLILLGLRFIVKSVSNNADQT